MSEWTLGRVKAHNMEINALCEADGCRQFYTFNLDSLIADAGADFLLADIPALACPACGGPLLIRLSFAGPDPEAEDE